MPTSACRRVLLAALLPALAAGAAPAALASTAAPVPMKTAYLSDMVPLAMSNGWGPYEKDMSNGEIVAGDGRALTLDGTVFAKGLGVHAASDLRYRVPAGCTQFISTIGVDDEVGENGSVIFQLHSGPTKLYDSGLRNGYSRNLDVSIPVTPGSVLGLVVTDGGNGPGMDHANWADARFTCSESTATAPSPAPATSADPVSVTVPRVDDSSRVRYVSDLTATAATNGWGPMEKDRSNGEKKAGDGRRLTLAGQGFDKGLGVHAPSAVIYTVPDNCTRFDSVVGVDDEVAQHGSIVFRIFQDQVKLFDSGLRTGSAPNVLASVVVKPGTALRLVVTDGGNGNGKDHADWADARFTCVGPGPSEGPAAPAPSPSAVISAPSPSASPSAAPSPSPVPTVGPINPPATTPTTPSINPDGPVSSDPSQPLGVAGAWSPLFTDDFGGSTVDKTKWNDHEHWESGGWRADAAWNPVPTTQQQAAIANGQLTMKARRGSGLPSGATFTSSHLNTRGKFAIPAGVTSYTEARLRVPSGKALLPQFWLLGNGDNSTGEGWPINGEVDILEMANNKYEAGSPYFSVWYPKDVYSSAPGTWLNGTHDTNQASFAKRPGLYDSWHTWGIFRSPERMDVYIDGVKTFTFLPRTSYMNGMPLPPMLFTNSMHIRLSLGVGGGWAGQGYSEPEFQEGDYGVQYVKVWKAS